MPAVAGESLTLRCLAWGPDESTRIRTTFYKDNKEISAHGSEMNITSVTESDRGTYKCDATYTNIASVQSSDNQDLYLQGMHEQSRKPLYHFSVFSIDIVCFLFCPFPVSPMKVTLTNESGLTCHCPACSGDISYRWYMYDKYEDQKEIVKEAKEKYITPKKNGSYACRVMWINRRSPLSNSIYSKLLLSLIFCLCRNPRGFRAGNWSCYCCSSNGF